MRLDLRYKFLEKLFRLVTAYAKDRIEGLENLPPKGVGYIAAANHRSFVDGLLLPQTLVTARKEPVHMVSYSELFNLPVFGRILRWAHGLVLDRNSQRGIERFFRDAKYILTQRHEAVGMHPEAHISKTGKLGRGRPGTSRLAIETGCPVVPIALFGTDVVVPPNTGERSQVKIKLNYKRRAMSFRAGKPMYFREYEEAYNEGDPRTRKEILDGITTLIMLEIAKLTGQTYHFGERSLVKLKKHAR